MFLNSWLYDFSIDNQSRFNLLLRINIFISSDFLKIYTMLITEYRILLPLTLEEYNKGQRYTIMIMNKSNTGGGEGIEYIENDPYTAEDGKEGQYTHILYKFESRVPKVIRAMAPSGSFDMFEESWDSFPRRRTLMKNKYLESKFVM